MRQVLIRRGSVDVEKVPSPVIEPGHILVEVAYSLISVGTEMSGVQGSGKPLIKRALEQPEKAMRVFDLLREQGIQKTVAKVRGQLDAGNPTGYSCSGIVIQVGEGVTDIHPGDRVACAGAGLANHAEIVLVPRNLVVQVPDRCDLKDAASVTLGAVAMQGVRRSDPRLGDIIAVVGLGLLGQLTVQLLKAAGCRVIGIDLDTRRVELAKTLGADAVFISSEADVNNEIRHLTNDQGVDAVIITAASQSDAIAQQAMEITRRKGVVVVVGAVGLGLQRDPFYRKELDFLISCSYGPGRYDSTYEEDGIDYPYAYVRWTENRNMAEYLRLVAEEKIELTLILEREYDVAEADKAYDELKIADAKPLGVILRYPIAEGAEQEAKLATKVPLKSAHQSKRQSKNGKVNIAVVGAGGFAQGMHLPNLQRLSNLYHIRAIVSGTGSNATNVAKRYDADYSSSHLQDVLDDHDVDAVLISTRHHLHARQAEAAAQAGKAILLEKPMALTFDELQRLSTVLEETQVPFMVGFNRRFSPAAQQAKTIITRRQNPLMISYRVNAGYLPPDHWTRGPEGGGRIIGEACHMFDLFQFFVDGSPAEEVTSLPIKGESYASGEENVVTTIRYQDGSVATLLYSGLGTPDYPKESVEIYADGKILVIDDYRTLKLYGVPTEGWQSPIADKGHEEELRRFFQYVRAESGPPIALHEMIETTHISLIASGKEVAECAV